jgi:dienelactone hydrolase
MRRALLALGLAGLTAGCGSSAHRTATTTTTTTRTVFAYDASAPLEYMDRGRVNRRGYPIAVHDVSFSSGGRRIDGFLLLPPGSARRPAVVFVPGTGGDRSELLSEAAWLAAEDVVTLTLSPPPAQTRPSTQTAAIEQLESETAAEVVAVRRAVDVLRSLPTVDPSRIGYVGWSAGGRLGAIVAASEPRIRGFVLLSAGAAPVSSYVATAPRALRGQLRHVLRSIDPLAYVGRARPGSLLLENGRRDTVVPRTALTNVVRAVPRGTIVRWYATSHGLNRQAYRDAFAWLARRLPIDGPPVSGAQRA